jgi:sigma-B regulation protein RsbU (phosphoserine phosphatase)
MQLATLPAETPPVPGVELAVGIEFAQDVGGDLYLFLQAPGCLGLAVGDVCGKGVPAALAATSITHLLPWLHPLQNPAQALANLNDDLVQHLPGNSFASLCLAILELDTGRLRIWNCGHPPPLRWHAATGRVLEAAVHNRLLGILSPWEGHEEVWQLEPGDVVLLYSDGLSEARNTTGELFGESRAAEVVAAHSRRPAGEILEAVRSAVEAWGTPSDDVTLLICKYLAPGERARAAAKEVAAGE